MIEVEIGRRVDEGIGERLGEMMTAMIPSVFSKSFQEMSETSSIMRILLTAP